MINWVKNTNNFTALIKTKLHHTTSQALTSYTFIKMYRRRKSSEDGEGNGTVRGGVCGFMCQFICMHVKVGTLIRTQGVLEHLRTPSLDITSSTLCVLHFKTCHVSLFPLVLPSRRTTAFILQPSIKLSLPPLQPGFVQKTHSSERVERLLSLLLVNDASLKESG